MKSYGVTIQMKATEQYFRVVLFIIMYMVVLTFESNNATIQMKGTAQSVVLLTMLYKCFQIFRLWL